MVNSEGSILLPLLTNF